MKFGLVIVGDQGSFHRCADLPVVPDDGVEGEDALADARPEAVGVAGIVAFEAELVLQRPDDRFDALV
ncbi:hypothetical protein AB0L76_25965 [Nonomuraea fuscirosea]